MADPSGGRLPPHPFLDFSFHKNYVYEQKIVFKNEYEICFKMLEMAILETSIFISQKCVIESLRRIHFFYFFINNWLEIRACLILSRSLIQFCKAWVICLYRPLEVEFLVCVS